MDALEPDAYYRQAFARNLGLISEQEQQRLQSCRVAVAGLGGVGGSHLLTLTRMGIGAFHIADLDEFSTVNTNRQVGATASSVGRPKVDVMAAMCRDINPHVDLRLFDNGVQADNVHTFLNDVDVVVDAIDFFAMTPRRLLYKTARELGKTVVFAAPIGFSGTLHVFSPDGMSFDEYYAIDDAMPLYDKIVAFAIGLTPRGTHWRYMDTSKVKLSDHAGPSISSACMISTGLLTTEVLTILLQRRPPQSAPRFVQFDPYRQIYRRGRLRWGNRGPLQRLKRWLVGRKFRDQAASLTE